MNRLPDFVIIGAMKCATSTLHDQLGAQPGFFVSDPKEPYFFSDDPVWNKGLEWYQSLFADAAPGDICGESTTHYTKLPTYPHTIERMAAHIGGAKLIYVMRHPIDRLVSQYVHQWTENEISSPIDEAIHTHPELIAYSRYSMQLEPFFTHWQSDEILPVFFERLRSSPQAELERVASFVGYEGTPVWADLESSNVSSQRMRKSPLRDMIIEAPGLTAIRQKLIPQSVRDRIKDQWKMSERPALSDESVAHLTSIFDEDLERLSSWIGVTLTCETWSDTAADLAPLSWVLQQLPPKAA